MNYMLSISFTGVILIHMVLQTSLELHYARKIYEIFLIDLAELAQTCMGAPNAAELPTSSPTFN